MKTQWLACLALVLGACPSVTVDDNEGVLGPTVEFDPANSVVPFPNNLLLNPATGKLSLPQQCNESAATTATRTNVLNKLDGFGTYEVTLNVTFTEPVDLASLDGRVVVFQRASGGEGNDPLTAIPIPVIAVPTKTVRFQDKTNLDACADPVTVEQVTFIPKVALDQKSTYTVALLDGIKTAAGDDFVPSFTWALVRNPQPVVAFDDAGNITLNRTPLDPIADKESLAGIELLWNAHHNAVTFLAGTGHDSEELLLAWEFNTQTVNDPLDPSVEGSPAADLTAAPLIGNAPIGAVIPGLAKTPGPRAGLFAACDANDTDTQCFLRIALGLTAAAPGSNAAVIYATGTAVCAQAGCAAVGEIRNSITLSKQYRADGTNPYTGTGAQPVPGAWSDPISPTVVHNTDNANPLLNDPQARIESLVLLPATPAPADGYPVAIFQHGITRSKNDVFGIMGALTSNGIAVVAIDASNHGSRAVRISTEANPVPALNCTDVLVGFPAARADRGPDPTTNPGCYAPIISSDLAATRDGFRQSILDLHQLAASVKACGTTACGSAVKFDATKISYVGHSMGGIFGGMFSATNPEVAVSVLDVAGAGWVDVLENTQQVTGFQCPLVDALIDAGSLTCGDAPCTEADKFNPLAPGGPTGLCLTDAWKSDPGYRQFAVIGRWVLDPADPANFASRLASKKFLLQRVDGDEVVPNIATDNLGALAGQLKGDASCGAPIAGSVPPSSAIVAAPTSSLFLDYLTFAPGSAECAPGNTFGHGSLLKPEPSVLGVACNPNTGVGCDGSLATQRLQTDAVFFLLANLDLL
jgi:pimeloyl-ACP methyl ester carboxylesterase